MRKIIVALMLLLLLPFVTGINVQADETDPPPDPGTQDGDGDIEGDHPWGGEDQVVIVPTDPDPDRTIKETVSFVKYFKLFLYSTYGIDLLDTPKTEISRTGTVTRYRSPSRDSYRFSSAKRSR